MGMLATRNYKQLDTLKNNQTPTTVITWSTSLFSTTVNLHEICSWGVVLELALFYKCRGTEADMVSTTTSHTATVVCRTSQSVEQQN